MTGSPQRPGRLPLAAVLAAGLLLATFGCETAQRPAATGKQTPFKILPGKSDSELRKKVEADPFPSAAKAGIL